MINKDIFESKKKVLSNQSIARGNIMERKNIQKYNKTQRKRTLEKRRQQSIKRTSKLSSEELEERKKKRTLYMRNYRAEQSEEARAARLQQVRDSMAAIRASESDQAREVRLQQMRNSIAEIRASESDQAREVRWQQMSSKKYMAPSKASSHLSLKKNMAPSKAYWNNLDPRSIPEVIAELFKLKKEYQQLPNKEVIINKEIKEEVTELSEDYIAKIKDEVDVKEEVLHKEYFTQYTNNCNAANDFVDSLIKNEKLNSKWMNNTVGLDSTPDRLCSKQIDSHSNPNQFANCPVNEEDRHTVVKGIITEIFSDEEEEINHECPQDVIVKKEGKINEGDCHLLEKVIKTEVCDNVMEGNEEYKVTEQPEDAIVRVGEKINQKEYQQLPNKEVIIKKEIKEEDEVDVKEEVLHKEYLYGI
ncbi:uncharacterized protein LOC126976328 isoform X3 [Leptidea sinapis]|uniref:uncharacterized protein LOC126976328 isoform X3 n=1 Tax=Leptidea sinapis TaxID=189913 RepID=UPI0021C2CB9B|nr:uncharacterized protein LOC126976328 isoform X3 [Leptidea sinapis]